MLTGEYQHNIDKKGRLIIPAKFREELGERFMITKGIDNCLFVYSMEEWNALAMKLKAKFSFSKAKERAFLRSFFSGACECEVDSMGRILIPANLRAYAALKDEKSAIIAGVIDRMEIWNKAAWEQYCEDNSDLAGIVEDIDSFDID